MPASTVSVNLLDQDQFEQSPVGRIVGWAVTFGRYIMITTEMVVLLAFISRFSLDRKLTDLNESISQKQIIIEANKDFEDEFNKTQEKIKFIKNHLAIQQKPVDNLFFLKSIMPTEVFIEKLNIAPESISGEAQAGTTAGFATFINNLKTHPEFNDISLGEIKKNPLTGIAFTFNARKEQVARNPGLTEVTEEEFNE